jgi:hypothetical protein
MEESTAKLTLEADDSKWSAGIDKATTSLNNWSTASLSKAEEAVTKIGEKFGQITGLLTGAVGEGEETVSQLVSRHAASLGEKYLGSFGSAIGGGVGDLLGALIETVDTSTLFEEDTTGESFVSGIKSTFDDLTDITGKTISTLKDTLLGFKPRDLLQGGFSGLTDGIAELSANIGTVLREGLVMGMASVADALNGVFNLVKQPLAAVATGVQGLLEYFGLIEESTESWGVALTNIQDIGVGVFQVIAYAIGSIKDILTVISGVISEYLIGPLTRFVGYITQAVAQFLNAIAWGLAKIGSVETAESLRRLASQVGSGGERITQMGRDISEAGAQNQKQRIGETGENWANGVSDMIGQGREININRRNLNEIRAKFEAEMEKYNTLLDELDEYAFELEMHFADQDIAVNEYMDKIEAQIKNLGVLAARADLLAKGVGEEAIKTVEEAEKRLNQIKKGIDLARPNETPLDQLINQKSALDAALEAGKINQEAFDSAMGRLLQDFTDKAAPDRLGARVSAASAGSQEAANAVTAARLQDTNRSDPQERLQRAVERQRQIQEQQLTVQKQLLSAYRDSEINLI